jgi:uracil-DNA glycosylase family 4
VARLGIKGMICRKLQGQLDQINQQIQACTNCELCKLSYNIKDTSKGFGKLYGWQGGNKKCRFMFVGMNPSHNRYEGHEFAFGGKEGSPGPGQKFNLLLREINIFEEFFIDNLIHCSSETNTINETWAKNCIKFLLDEINVLKPFKIITMGRSVLEILKPLLYEHKIKIEIENIWHPSYIFSYQRESVEKYKQMILKACEVV